MSIAATEHAHYFNSIPAALREAPTGRGDWMQTYTGRAYFPHDPRPEEVHIEDIAHGLSMQCRYAGQCDRPYCTAEHSWFVSYMVERRNALAGLMHDAPETYLNDMVRPVKVGLPEYYVLELKNWKVIAYRFGLPVTLPHDVHQADNAILFSERDQNMKPPPYAWKLPDPGYRVKLHFWSAKKAEKMFLRRYRELTGTQTRWERFMEGFWGPTRSPV